MPSWTMRCARRYCRRHRTSRGWTIGCDRSGGGASMTRDMRTLDYAELRHIMGEQPYPLLFATVSGAHLYGFPSRDSDVDLRGVHVLPAAEVVGLRTGPET